MFSLCTFFLSRRYVEGGDCCGLQPGLHAKAYMVKGYFYYWLSDIILHCNKKIGFFTSPLSLISGVNVFYTENAEKPGFDPNNTGIFSFRRYFFSIDRKEFHFYVDSHRCNWVLSHMPGI